MKYDIQYLDHLLFSTILSVAEGNAPCLPSGLSDFRTKLESTGQPGGPNTLKQLLNHYSLINKKLKVKMMKACVWNPIEYIVRMILSPIKDFCVNSMKSPSL